MAEIGAPFTLSTDSFDIDFNEVLDNGGMYIMQDTSGLDGVPVRAPIEDAPQTDGALIFPSFDEARHITLQGFLDQGTGGLTNRNQMELDLIQACYEIKAPNEGQLIYSPTGMAPRTYTVTCDIQPTFPGKTVLKEYIFGIVAADASYSTDEE